MFVFTEIKKAKSKSGSRWNLIRKTAKSKSGSRWNLDREDSKIQIRKQMEPGSGRQQNPN
jgi:hypothetical protein